MLPFAPLTIWHTEANPPHHLFKKFLRWQEIARDHHLRVAANPEEAGVLLSVRQLCLLNCNTSKRPQACLAIHIRSVRTCVWADLVMPAAILRH